MPPTSHAPPSEDMPASSSTAMASSAAACGGSSAAAAAGSSADSSQPASSSSSPCAGPADPEAPPCCPSLTVLSLGDELGRGAFGVVRSAVVRLHADGSTRDAVVKTLLDRPGAERAWRREVEFLEAARGVPYVTAASQARAKPARALLMDSASLAALARQLLTAVKGLHARSIAHYLGAAAWATPEGGLDHCGGTNGYMSKEVEAVIRRDPTAHAPSLQSDMPSVAAVLLSAAHFANDSGMLACFRDGHTPLPAFIPPPLVALLKALVRRHPAQRLDPEAALATSFLAQQLEG
ncbi:hypothetical protein HYH03_010959 [Edaphochlamys debaryana]|uniref:Protein kinase domain-containing protein n=1 Tax=Edaphochlamys debaryana TaxID=47281 RepID=A0A835Y100_9CHLO|nr:hypothetical protein HYH03_010959 [Edaphochlamys debaryana]|eukprot:KAG2490565.1 hypothetical protein HYH03_010959 [Edaphochlamys debaryana]